MKPKADEAAPSLDKEYSYDAMGNRVAVTSQGQRTDYGANNLNQITQLASNGEVTVITHDANGNMTAIGNKQLGYDNASRLTSVVLPGEKKSEFVYDSEGRKRIARKYSWIEGAWVLDDQTRFVYDGMELIQERAADGSVKAR
jgi:uncharacterized protein RhaS with RHS repeats